MSCEISEALNRLAAEYEHAATQKERNRLRREIARVSYSQEADRAKSRRNSRQGAFDAAMLSLDAHMETFDDPSKIATFSDGGKGAEHVRSYVGCEDVHSGEIDTAVKKRMLNKLRKYPHLQKTLRRFIRNATSEKRRPVKKTHIEKICEILF